MFESGRYAVCALPNFFPDRSRADLFNSSHRFVLRQKGQGLLASVAEENTTTYA